MERLDYTMADSDLAAIDLMTGSGLVSYGIDNKRAVMALRAAPIAIREDVRAMILRKRARHREMLTIWQREWQLKTRRPNRARHHDSISIRERYVRCAH